MCLFAFWFVFHEKTLFLYVLSHRQAQTISLPFFFIAVSSLMSQGYSLEDIASATMEADEISRDRANSANAKNWDKVNEVSERFSRLFTKALKTKKPTPLKSQSAGQAA